MADANEKRFDRAVENWNKITFASVLLAIPVFILVALGAPAWVGIGYAIAMGCVLAVFVVRGVRGIYGRWAR